MGTRHLIGVVVDGAPKVAQYGQWDGYPDGQGLKCLMFVRELQETEGAEKLFADACRKLTWLTDEGFRKAWETVLGREPKERETVTLDESKAFESKFPWLHRDAGAEVLRYVYSGRDVQLRNSWGFAGDSLFCEWAYVLDLDERCLEVYRGFNQDPVPEGERFASKEGLESNDKYEPVRLARKFAFDDLPSDEMFVAAFMEEDDEDEE